VSHLPAVVARTVDGHVAVRVHDGPELLLPGDGAGQEFREGEAVVLAFRAADVELTPGPGTWQGTVASAVYLGGREEYLVQVGSTTVRAERAATRLTVGATVGVRVPSERVKVWRSPRA
jgi:ABC-type Fe3+/spermidine/putrescine transport system ATPase subunit